MYIERNEKISHFTIFFSNFNIFEKTKIYLPFVQANKPTRKMMKCSRQPVFHKGVLANFRIEISRDLSVCVFVSMTECVCMCVSVTKCIFKGKDFLLRKLKFIDNISHSDFPSICVRCSTKTSTTSTKTTMTTTALHHLSFLSPN